jgi:putative cell wall binding repeat protein
VPRVRHLLVALLASAAVLAGCDKDSGDIGKGPVIGKKGGEESAAPALGFPAFATKNTTRVGGADPTADAAGVARAVYSATSDTTRPFAVTLVDRDDWQGGIAASVLMSSPVRAPILLSDGDELPDASRSTLTGLGPSGARPLGGAQVVRVGDVAEPRGAKSLRIGGGNPYALAAQIDRVAARAAGRSSDRVVIASGERPEFAMPAAGWAAKSGDPVLYAKRDELPRETVAALRLHQQPKIYVLGPPSVISDRVLAQLRRLGTVTRIGGRDAVANAIAFARFVDGRFGWGVVDPGHGLVFASTDRPLDAAAASPLSASGKYGPLLLVTPGSLPTPLVQYLLDVQPGYERDPVRGVYNHGWLIGDERAISVEDQARIDSLLEIVPVNASPPANRPSS